MKIRDIIKAIGAGFRTVQTVMPPSDYDFSSSSLILRFLAMGQEEDSPRQVKVTNPYLQNAWVFSAIRIMAMNLSMVDFKLYQVMADGEEVELTGTKYGWIKRLFDYVSVNQNKFTLFESIVTWLSLRGEAFWILKRAAEGTPVSIRFPHPDTMEAIVRNGELVMWGEWQGSNRIYHELEDVIQFKYYNPFHPYRGLSPLVAASLGMDVDFAATAYNYYFFNNDSSPAGQLSTDQDLTPEEAEAIETRIRRKLGGLKKRGKILVTGRGTKYVPIALAQKDVMYIEQKKWSRDEVFAVLGVPPALSQVLEHASIKSNIREQRKQLYENTLIPIMKYIEDVLRTEFFDREGLKEIKGKFDISSISVLSETLSDKIKVAIRLKDLGFTANEINKRLELGFEEKPWRDIWWIPMNLIPATEGNGTGDKSKKMIVEPRAAIITEKEKTERYERMWKRIMMTIRPFQNAMQKDIEDYFYELRTEVMTKIFAKKSIKAVEMERIEADFLWKEDDWNIKLMDITKPRYEAVYEASVEDMVETFGSTFTSTSQRAIRTINSKAIKIVEINETIREQVIDGIRPIISRGLEVGASYDELAKELATEVKNIFNNARRRTKTVARTEVNGTMSQARWDGMNEAGIERHQWYSTRLIRESHIGNHMEIRKVGEYFPSGIRYPHDEVGPPEEVINCSCITVPVVD